MLATGHSIKIINGVTLESVIIRGKEIKIRVRSEYFADNGFDVAVAVENGTKKHWVEPKERGSSIIGTPTGDRPKKALHWESNGKNFFSKGHIVGGIPKHHIIRDTIKEFAPQTKEKITTALSAWTNSILQGN